MELRDLYVVLVFCHGLAGALSLVAALVPVLARKGGAVHRRAGWAFVAAMCFTATTGLVLAGLWLAVPLAIHRPSTPLGPEEAAAVAGRIRVFAVFLCYLAALIFAGVWHGVRVLRQRRPGAPGLGQRALDRGLPALLVVGGVAMVCLGLARGSALLAGFGILGLAGGYSDLRAVGATPARGPAAVLRHMEAMLGAVIAALTAFAVFGSGRLPGSVLPASLYFVPWLLPAALGIPAIAALKRRYRRGSVAA